MALLGLDFGDEEKYYISLNCIQIDILGPQDDPNDCGTPILCGFYGLLLFIILMVIYTTIKGSTE